MADVVAIAAPKTRGDCLPGGVNAIRPCRFKQCRYHLGGEFPQGRRQSVEDVTCVLDIADEGPVELNRIGDIFGVSRERIRQVEEKALARLNDHHPLSHPDRADAIQALRAHAEGGEHTAAESPLAALIRETGSQSGGAGVSEPDDREPDDFEARPRGFADPAGKAGDDRLRVYAIYRREVDAAAAGESFAMGNVPLSPRQVAVLNACRAHRAAHGVWPTFMDLADAIGLEGSSDTSRRMGIRAAVDPLERAGAVAWEREGKAIRVAVTDAVPEVIPAATYKKGRAGGQNPARAADEWTAADDADVDAWVARVHGLLLGGVKLRAALGMPMREPPDFEALGALHAADEAMLAAPEPEAVPAYMAPEQPAPEPAPELEPAPPIVASLAKEFEKPMILTPRQAAVLASLRALVASGQSTPSSTEIALALTSGEPMTSLQVNSALKELHEKGFLEWTTGAGRTGKLRTFRFLDEREPEEIPVAPSAADHQTARILAALKAAGAEALGHAEIVSRADVGGLQPVKRVSQVLLDLRRDGVIAWRKEGRGRVYRVLSEEERATATLGRMGGAARAAALTPERRSEIARMGSLAMRARRAGAEPATVVSEPVQPLADAGVDLRAASSDDPIVKMLDGRRANLLRELAEREGAIVLATKARDQTRRMLEGVSASIRALAEAARAT